MKGADCVAEVALGVALVVGLCERLPRQGLVRDLCVPAVAVRVVCAWSFRGPFKKPDAGLLSGLVELVVE
jgi:hypothetical protein